jgi:hypothetical protein
MGKTNKIGASTMKDMVITPGGARHKSDVHLIEPGHHLSGKDGIFRKIHTATGEIIKEFGAINKGNKNRKALRRKRKFSKGGLAEAINPQPITDQWIIYAGWNNNSGKPISSFTTNWLVPNPPVSQDNQLLYLFNGLENASNDVILQPVLQWGSSPIGGGNYWAIANWYVGAPGSGLAFHSPLIPVNTGVLLQGVMTLTSQQGNSFSYKSSFTGYATDLPVNNVDELVWAVETLECYGLKQFSDYPSSPVTAMKDIEIKLGLIEAAIQWESYNAVTDNGQHCDVISNSSPDGEVDLCYT